MERLPLRRLRGRGLSRAANDIILTLNRTRAIEKRNRLLRALRAVGYPWVRVVDRGAAPEPLDEIALPRACPSPPRTDPQLPGSSLSDAREGDPEEKLGESEEYVAIRQVERGEVVAEESATARVKTVPCSRGCFRGGVHLNARCATLASNPAPAELLPLFTSSLDGGETRESH